MELDRPWGSYKVTLYHAKKNAQEGDEDFEPKELTGDWVKDFFIDSVEPEPVSIER